MKTSLPSLPSTASAAVAALGLFLTTSVPTSAAVVGSFALNGDGTVTYSYEIENASGTFDIAAWSLEFDFAVPDWDPLDTFAGGDTTVPNANWIASSGIPIMGGSARDFLSLDPSGDVAMGGLLSGFSFTSRYLPGTVAYYEFSALGDVVIGSVIGPVSPRSSVPEGGSSTGIALAMLAGVAVHRHLGKRTASV